MDNKTQTNKKILIVEDEHDIRLLYSEVLTDAGYEVIQAPDGELGIEKIHNSDWDLLLLDIILPVKDGIRILKEMKEKGTIDKGPIIMLTNLASEHIIEEAFDLGADGYLIKSEITPDKILTEVENVLKKNSR